MPAEFELLDAEDSDATEQLEHVRIELHAQDIDRAKRGWAAIVPEISPNRLRMEIYPPLKPQDIYTKSQITGNIVLVSRRADNGEMEPYMFHLVRLRE